MHHYSPHTPDKVDQLPNEQVTVRLPRARTKRGSQLVLQLPRDGVPLHVELKPKAPMGAAGSVLQAAKRAAKKHRSRSKQPHELCVCVAQPVHKSASPNLPHIHYCAIPASWHNEFVR